MTYELLVAALAAPFDAEAATQAYLGTLKGAARARSDAYFEGGYWLPLWGAAIAVLSYWIMLRTGWSAAWSAWAGRVTKREWLRPALYSIPFGIVGALMTLPWSAYTGYVREHQYGMSNHSLGAWLGEQATVGAVGLVIGMVAFVIIYAVIRKSPKRWWLWGAGAMTVMLTLMIMLAPIFIEPLLNRYTPLAEGPVRSEILRIAHEQSIPANDVFVVDASRQTKRISANVAGLGPTVRIALNDNLLNRSNIHGIKAVMGHEMGHYKLNHVPIMLLMLAAMALAGFAVASRLVPRLIARHGERWGVRSIADPASAPILYAVLSVLALAAIPLINNVVRYNENEADAFGLDAAREPDGFAMSAMQLSEYRKIEPSGLEEFLFYDHPSGRTRVRRAMEWKARNLDKLPADQRAMMVMTADKPVR